MTKARSLLEIARKKCPQSEDLWLETVKLEREAGNLPLANQRLSAARQAIPSSGSGYLWNVRNRPDLERDGVDDSEDPAPHVHQQRAEGTRGRPVRDHDGGEAVLEPEQGEQCARVDEARGGEEWRYWRLLGAVLHFRDAEWKRRTEKGGDCELHASESASRRGVADDPQAEGEPEEIRRGHPASYRRAVEGCDG